MEYLIIAFVSAAIAGLTLFSGFGLGTVLLPVFAIFFPIDVAIGMTAIVHLLNNILKFILLGKSADKTIVLKFGIPAIVAAFLGAWILIKFLNMPPIFNYQIGSKEFLIEPVKLIIGLLMIMFAMLEISPKLSHLSVDKKYLPFGGLLSGFFGGLSGHQGAFRSVFLLRANLTKESFIATGVIIACLVDVSRLIMYSSRFEVALKQGNLTLLLVAIVSVFLGVFIGNRLLKKITMRTVQIIIGIMLFGIAVGLISGII
ncbi:sulfite exporter TauE/SafE family protein [candidate division KSB1 bacterium]|nr:sulfite exporter TauE/SafE family protein [candidate division KSB1 bacterium]